MSPSPDYLPNTAGFSLIETLVVVAILAGLVSAAALPMARLLERRLVETQAARVADLFNVVRRRALMDGHGAAIRIDLETRTLSARTGVVTLPFDYAMTMEATGELQRERPIHEVWFGASGLSSGAALRLRRGSSSARIVVDWLTGRVEVRL